MLRLNLQLGFSLFELVLSLGLFAGVCITLQHSILYFYQMGWQISKQIELRQGVMSLGRRISKEIKRANFVADLSSNTKMSPAYFSHDCLLISYDFNRNGELSNTISSSEFVAYRWYQQRIEYAVVNSSCQADYWQSLLEERQFLITEFKITQPIKNILKLELSASLLKIPKIKFSYIDWISIQNGSW